jgi:hypothetical protein
MFKCHPEARFFVKALLNVRKIIDLVDCMPRIYHILSKSNFFTRINPGPEEISIPFRKLLFFTRKDSTFQGIRKPFGK